MPSGTGIKTEIDVRIIYGRSPCTICPIVNDKHICFYSYGCDDWHLGSEKTGRARRY